jgi:methionyl-tRNA formyltransferase
MYPKHLHLNPAAILNQSPRIVFLGTPDFAVASLAALLSAGYNVVGVVTAPDKPAGRGMQLQQSAVKKFADAHGLPTLQPPKLKDPDFLATLAALNADLQVVVAFRMLPEVVWNMPPMGTVNVHGSLLPQYRGAAPINWAIINGETTTGVTIFKLKHAIDTGDVLLQSSLAIGPNETAGQLHDRIMMAGANLLVQAVYQLCQGQLAPLPQPTADQPGLLRHAPKLFTPECLLNPNQTCAELHNRVRGLSPYPGAFTSLHGKSVKIFLSLPLPGPTTQALGAWASNGKTYLHLACADGYLNILELQLEGKKRMGVEDFLRGFKWA